MNRKIFVYIVSLILPFALLPLALSTDKESKCTFVMVIVAAYWLLEPVPIAATSLLPIVLFPILGVVSSSEICKNYMKESFMMFVGGLIVAIAVEDCKLHERIALKVLLLIGSEIKWLMMGFMITTMLLSMWISNTATTAMMVPIVDAVIGKITMTTNCNDIELEENNSLTESKQVCNTEDNGKSNTKKVLEARSSTLKVACLLSVCYAANIGGTGTLTGTGPNLVLKGMLEELHPESTDITFATWMMYNVPGMILCVLIGWFYLWLVYVRCSNIDHNIESKERIHEIISKRYIRLGRLSSHEASVIVLFLILVFLWVFRDPKFIPGWASIFGSDTKIGDSAPAIAVSFLLFYLPSNLRDLNSRPLLEWKTAQAKLPWGVLLLLGGGFALAHGAQESGLSELLGEKLSSLNVLPPGAVVAIICFMTAMITEIASNTTAATILLPVLNQMAISIGVNPLCLMLPVSIVCSYAFMLPVATPPNAIAFENGNMRTIDMAKPGLVMNLVCCGVQLFMVNTLGVAMFDLNTFPSWAKHSLHQNMTSRNISDLANIIANASQYMNETLLT
ncbi:Solute carrier family 13 member 5 like protein [Argiope bruennichi]|uniref:Solute carrier family 13 member 5 like protein n=1 Tax=Argiope bruennichi TaxID=94029 RepID=A0A8T0E8T1_ARGBR|nr:Solute carrier family 13 member 5 like protein [Argiope bruennichi]